MKDALQIDSKFGIKFDNLLESLIHVVVSEAQLLIFVFHGKKQLLVRQVTHLFCKAQVWWMRLWQTCQGD